MSDKKSPGKLQCEGLAAPASARGARGEADAFGMRRSSGLAANHTITRYESQRQEGMSEPNLPTFNVLKDLFGDEAKRSDQQPAHVCTELWRGLIDRSCPACLLAEENEKILFSKPLDPDWCKRSSMNFQQLNGREITQIHLSDGINGRNYLHSGCDGTMRLIASQDESWVSVLNYDGNEIARYNSRHIRAIHWKDPL